MSFSFFIQELAGVPIWWYLVGAGLAAGAGIMGLLLSNRNVTELAHPSEASTEANVYPALNVEQAGVTGKPAPIKTTENEPKKQSVVPNEVQLKRSSALRRATGTGENLPTLADELILRADAPPVARPSAAHLRRRAKKLA